MKEQILNLSEELLIRLTGYEPSLMSMLIKNFTFSFFFTFSIFFNFTPHETIFRGDRDPHPHHFG